MVPVFGDSFNFRYRGGRESQIVTESSIFSEPIQNIYQVQMTTEKCRWRRKKNRFTQKFWPFISQWWFSRQSLAEKNPQKGQNPIWPVNFSATVILRCLQRSRGDLQLSMESTFTGNINIESLSFTLIYAVLPPRPIVVS